MDRVTRAAGTLFLFCLLCPGRHVFAWEIELQERISSSSAVVRLGDIGRIKGLPRSDAAELEQVVLVPGPSPAYTRSLPASQVRKILKRRGIELSSCRFSGARRSVVVYGNDSPPSASMMASKQRLSAGEVNPRDVVLPASYRSRGGIRILDRIEERIGELVNAKLEELTEEPRRWDVEAKISRGALQELPSQWDSLTVEELETPKEGSHQLVACFQSDQGSVRVPVKAEITPMLERVVPVRALRTGHVIRASDVELRYVVNEQKQEQTASELDEVLGKQVRLPLRGGEPLKLHSLETPILVRRRETVQAVARRGGIQVTRHVLAIDQGTLGETITVEALEKGDNRKKARFIARVVGLRRVEVCVSNASTQQLGGQ
ncbi:MAG: flagellar basal body P-ring formation chaperone FlgA [Planctomycetota bacterium]